VWWLTIKISELHPKYYFFNTPESRIFSPRPPFSRLLLSVITFYDLLNDDKPSNSVQYPLADLTFLGL